VPTVQGDLLTPTLQAHRPRDWSGRLPWRLESQVYPAILGGPLAATIVAVLNARRLQMPERTVRLMAGGGLAATLLALTVITLLDRGATRLLLGAAGVSLYFAFHQVQRPADRVHATFSPHDDPDDDYAPFLLPGAAAFLVGLAVQVAILLAVDGA
jgi:hypothetical protein